MRKDRDENCGEAWSAVQLQGRRTHLHGINNHASYVKSVLGPESGLLLLWCTCQTVGCSQLSVTTASEYTMLQSMNMSRGLFIFLLKEQIRELPINSQ